MFKVVVNDFNFSRYNHYSLSHPKLVTFQQIYLFSLRPQTIINCYHGKSHNNFCFFFCHDYMDTHWINKNPFNQINEGKPVVGMALSYQNIWAAINSSRSVYSKNTPNSHLKKIMFSDLTQFSHFTVIFHRLSFSFSAFSPYLQKSLCMWWHFFLLNCKKHILF